MKRFHPLLPALPVCLLLLLLLWRNQIPPAAETTAVAKVAVPAKPARALVKEAAPCCPNAASTVSSEELLTEASDLELPKRADLRWEEPMSESVFEEFRHWAAARPAARTGADLQHGIELAQQRRHALLNLIEKTRGGRWNSPCLMLCASSCR
jgi:hypothetical protein